MAFKMNGFPGHKGTQQHVGTRKGSAVFQKPTDPKKETKGETTSTVGDKVYTDWQTNPEGTEETRSWTQDTTYVTPHTPEGDAYYASLTDEQKAEADRKERERLEKLNKTDTGVETRPIDQPVEETPTSQYRTELIMDPGSTAGSRVSGEVSDPSGVMGIKVFGPGLPKGGRYLYHNDARGYSGKSGKFIGSIDELSQYEGLDYDAIMEGSGYGGGGTGEDLEVVKQGGSSTYKKLGGNRTKSWI